jgi:hypothetical protein
MEELKRKKKHTEETKLYQNGSNGSLSKNKPFDEYEIDTSDEEVFICYLYLIK